jgi:hypothetical protein
VRFDSGSQLRGIEEFAFKSWAVPSRVVFIGKAALRCDESTTISIDEAKDDFAVRECFLGSILDHSLIHDLGRASEATIPYDLEVLSSLCFGNHHINRLLLVRFENCSQLKRIDQSAVFHCCELGSIWIPWSVEMICRGPFAGRENLSILRFASCSKLSRVETGAIRRCESLQAISIRSAVEVIGFSCFAVCSSLLILALESVCTVSRVATRQVLLLALLWSEINRNSH